MRSMGIETEKVIPEGMPAELLAQYNINFRSCHKQENAWYVENEHDSYLIYEHQGNTEKLETALKWQDYLTGRGFTGVPKVVENKAGQLYVIVEGRTFFINELPSKVEFNGKKAENLLLAAEGLGRLHETSRGFYIDKVINNKKESWPKIFQERLTSLLTLFGMLKQERVRNDFERLYVENFDFLYSQGQEALQKMVMAGCGAGHAEHSDRTMLVNSFRSRELAVCDKGVLFLNLREWDTGSKTNDLALFINSYLPLHRWDQGLLRKIMERYRKNNSLNTCENVFLIGQLRFPSRYWLYTYQYLNGLNSIPELTQQFKSYVHDCYWRDRCLDSMESWL